MAITLSGTVRNGKYKITNLEDVDYIAVCILGSQDNSTKRDPPKYVYKFCKVMYLSQRVSYICFLCRVINTIFFISQLVLCERNPGEVTYLCVYYTIMATVGEFR
jgi:hypothetical protein